MQITSKLRYTDLKTSTDEQSVNSVICHMSDVSSKQDEQLHLMKALIHRVSKMDSNLAQYDDHLLIEARLKNCEAALTEIKHLTHYLITQWEERLEQSSVMIDQPFEPHTATKCKLN